MFLQLSVTPGRGDFIVALSPTKGRRAQIFDDSPAVRPDM